MLPSELFTIADNNAEVDIEKSLRFRYSANTSLNRDFNTTPADTNSRIKTYSFWIKRSLLGVYQVIISNSVNTSNFWYIGFDPSDKLNIYCNNVSSHGGVVLNKISTQTFRDPSSWYHIVVAVDTTNAIAEERVKAYVNGQRITSWTTNTNPGLNNYAASFLSPLSGTWYGRIGNFALNSNNIFEGYLSEFLCIDGLALDASYFGKTDTTTGQWVANKYLGDYGNNGFYLNFKDNSSLTTLAYDASGKNNHWTSVNHSLTVGVNYDSMLDTPTNNYPVWNVISPALLYYRNTGLQATTNLDPAAWNKHASATFTIPSTGKWYWEFTELGSSFADNAIVGLLSIEAPVTGGTYIGNFAKSHGVHLIKSAGGNAEWYTDGVTDGHFGPAQPDPGAGIASESIGFAFDADTNILEIFVGGVSRGTRTIPTSQSGTLRPAASLYSANLEINFGQRPFSYTPPSGFQSLCTRNLPTPSIKRGETGMDIATYTGNGGNIQVGEYQFPRPNYLIDKSLRFKGTTLTCLNRTPSSVGSQTKWTWSGWIKATSSDSLQYIFSAGVLHPIEAYLTGIQLYQSKISITDYRAGITYFVKQPSRIVKDNQWHHITAIFDSTNTTVADRAILYLDGIRQTSFSTSVDVPNNYVGYVNGTNLHRIGELATGVSPGGAQFFYGYMAEIHFIDGQALDASNFGEFDINGYWIPKAYTGTYGTNGFYLDFEDNSALANLGYDKSGNNNNWTPNNISLTAGTAYDSMTDSPTNNYAVGDVLRSYAVTTISNAGLTGATSVGSSYLEFVIPNLRPVNGKYYAEFSYTTLSSPEPVGPGIVNISNNNSFLYGNNGTFYTNGANPIAYGSTFIVGDIIGVALDLDNNILEFFKNGVSQGIKTSDFSGFTIAMANVRSSTSGSTCHANFGQRPFSYTPPAGFKTISIPNIAEYTYDLDTPDLVWIKSRNAATNHMLFDSVRGTGKYLSSNSTAIEATDVNSLVSFNKNGFYLGNNAVVNTLNNTYVAWMWKAGASKGFDVVSFNKPTTAPISFNHGLGIAPSFVIVKYTGQATNWPVYHALSPYLATNLIVLNNTAGVAATNYFAVTSSQITLTDTTVTGNGTAYCWSEIEGFSKFGSYIGNGSADGPFVYTGMKPRWIMIKNITGTSNWVIKDVSRDSSNIAISNLYSNLANAEDTTSTVYIDILSNGFKIRGTYDGVNTNTSSYIFAAFAETPFKYATGR